ncbi:MAG: lipoprotein [Polynucleobacter sp.]|nr:lipoprotein [Polynucleobacter sp.]
MKVIYIKHCSFLLSFCVILSITLSGCGVKGPLYLPPPTPEPVKPSKPEPKGKQWPKISPANPHTSP